MKKDDGLAIALFAMVIGGGVAIAIASDITAPLCEGAKIRSMAADKIEFGCFEFWLNRYQSLLGNVLTAGVAGATLYWLARQLLAADQQLETARREAAVSAATALREVAKDAEETLDRLQKIVALLQTVRGKLLFARPADNILEANRQCEMAEATEAVVIEAMDLLSKIQAKSAHGPVYDTTSTIAKQLTAIFFLIGQCTNLKVEMHSDVTRAEPAIRRLPHTMTALRTQVIATTNSLNPAVTAAFQQIEITWKQIRRFEAAAIGQTPSR
ncbi:MULTISPECIES: hypothetical protein [unclassified Bosea (in: a-proteobacteria)]|uniref:hypothetical protein n=1 Tax=unclassified Bosea (in: a-proteobacteria) TaxID=2653178 RepID=UPI000F753D3C|nr:MULTISPECIES: hypothetical protein [unclassified Bosea (in: a-proteobacteria)]AZO77731.1 hypothetical protein BLM15_08955 [Bosea sp. Tri-49]RXT18345.1 hypothetical protein B5U98_24110 [Bosea sp. Tri-39]RXT32941.1 hypothetical protein B5U99_30455 [Bosea sp. Tri-54]